MDNNEHSEAPQWLSPSAALQRFQPPPLAAEVGEGEPLGGERIRYGFRVGGLGLLIDQDTIGEVLEPLPIYPIPKTPAWLTGLINLRGNLVPIFDLKQALDVEASVPAKPMLLILGRGERAVGVEIDGLPRIPEQARPLTRLPPLPARLRDQVTSGLIDAEGELWLEFRQAEFFAALAA